MKPQVASAYTALVRAAEDRLKEANIENKIRIRVGSATCEHAAGSLDVFDEFRKHIAASGRQDIVLHQTGCTGRCSREPIVGVLVPGRMPVKYDRVNREKVHQIFIQHVLGGKPLQDQILDKGSASKPGKDYEFLFCTSERCQGHFATKYKDLFSEKIKAAGLDPNVVRTLPASCFGLCRKDEFGEAAFVFVRPDKILYRVASEADLDEIVEGHVKQGEVVERLRVRETVVGQEFFQLYGDVSFFSRQTRVALRNTGVINPESLDEFLHYKGFAALAKVLEKDDPNWVIDEITLSKLRGRGGAGYPTGVKWAHAVKATEPVRYMICNADEGDPGAFMDRDMLESDPFSVVEGMLIGAFAIRASRGFYYIRAEYPLAIKRIQNAIDQCRKNGLLGESVLDSGFSFDMEIRLGAGAFVCGEETALIHSIQGERGQPSIRPPYPTESGLWGKPTVINNVETLANVPVIINYGADWFGRIGTERSGGTKVFALAGKVKNTGLVEVPMGTTLREVVFDIGGGVPGNKQLKAVQTGGPAGGCIPARFMDTAVDYETLGQVGSIMGSGGMIIMDESDCMVDVAKFFMSFSQDESCGKCSPCREGTMRMLEILERITAGDGKPEDLTKLERLARLIKKTSLCGLGRAAPNPVLSTMQYFFDEYKAHVVDKVCPAGRCPALSKQKVLQAR